jgi:hypothetical protein
MRTTDTAPASVRHLFGLVSGTVGKGGGFVANTGDVDVLAWLD